MQKITSIEIKEALEWLRDNEVVLNISEVARQSGVQYATIRHYLDDTRPIPQKWREPLARWIIAFKAS